MNNTLMTKSIAAYQVLAVATIAALMFSLFAIAPASAYYSYHGSRGGEIDNSVDIDVDNHATVVSNTSASADTGDNTAGGSEGGEGGNGGDAEDNTGGDNTAGNGGNGGAASAGGLIVTGNASAGALSTNIVNTTDIDVAQADCGCAGSEDSYGHRGGRSSQQDVDNSVDIDVDNYATVTSTTEADADTGYNEAEGSEGGEAGNGGDVEDNGSSQNQHHWGWNNYGYGSRGGNNSAENTAGNGGNGGAGGVGGEVRTGAAIAASDSANVVNSTIVRVR